jgi:polysaccharide export outer membrane protein
MTDKLGKAAGLGPRVLCAIVAFCCFHIPVTSTAQVTTDRGAASAVANYVVQPGDVLSVLIWGWPAQTDKLEGRFPIESDGRVYLPVIGAVEVAGKTTERVQADLRARLAAEQRQAVIVIEPLFAVAVNGEVRLPSVYDFRPGQTVFDAISRAGGFTQDADREQLLLVRNGAGQNMTAATAGELAALLAQTPLQSGDRLLVSPRKRVAVNTILSVLQTAIAAVTLYTVLK